MMLEKLLDDPKGSKKFNRVWTALYEHLADFLSMHYKTSKLEHTEYWKSFDKVNNVKLPATKQVLFCKYSFRTLANARELPYTS
jgi:hypothetical protein